MLIHFDSQHLGKDQPNVDHLDISRLRKAVGHADEQGGEDEEGGEVDRDNGFKEKLLEKVGAVDNYHDEEGGDINGHYGIHYTPL